MSLRHSMVERLDALPSPARRPITAVWTLGQDLVRCDLMKQASAMAYVTLLSLIPSLVAIFCVLSLFSPLVSTGSSSLVDDIKDMILENLASGSGEAVVKYLDNMLGNMNLKSIGWSSFGTVLITLILLLRQIEGALNRIWLVHKGRNVFTRFMYFWTFLTLGIVVLAIIVGVSSGFDLRRILRIQEVAEAVSGDNSIFGHIAGWFGGFLFFFFLYKVVPNCQVRAKNAAIGAASSAVVLSAAAWVYTTFVITSKNYATLYGALAQLPLFLTWLYICWIIILVGALLTWRLQEGFPRESEEDTLDLATSPTELLRNVQVKAMMPLIAILAIYRSFQQGTGKGQSAQELAHALKLPVAWLIDALDALQVMGYVIAARPTDSDTGSTATDRCFPAFPAETLAVSKLRSDLARPSSDWMAHWHHELPMDLPKVITQIAAVDRSNFTLGELLARLPSTKAKV